MEQGHKIKSCFLCSWNGLGPRQLTQLPIPLFLHSYSFFSMLWQVETLPLSDINGEVNSNISKILWLVLLLLIPWVHLSTERPNLQFG